MLGNPSGGRGLARAGARRKETVRLFHRVRGLATMRPSRLLPKPVRTSEKDGRVHEPRPTRLCWEAERLQESILLLRTHPIAILLLEGLTREREREINFAATP